MARHARNFCIAHRNDEIKLLGNVRVMTKTRKHLIRQLVSYTLISKLVR